MSNQSFKELLKSFESREGGVTVLWSAHTRVIDLDLDSLPGSCVGRGYSLARHYTALEWGTSSYERNMKLLQISGAREEWIVDRLFYNQRAIFRCTTGQRGT